MPNGSGRAPPYAALALLSAGALSYEVVLIRLLSIVQWHHFASMIISLALLGYGAAGSFVTLRREALIGRFDQVFIACAAAFGASTVACFQIAQRIAFNPLELLWDPSQVLRLTATYLVLAVPFFFAASAICLAFARFGAVSHRIYAWDITGAGAGSLAVVAALFARDAAGVLLLAGGAGFLSAALAARRLPRAPASTAAFGVGAVLLAFALPPQWTRLIPSEYKDLSQQLRAPGARVAAEVSSPLGAISVVDSPRIPLRIAPGLSLSAASEPPVQLGVFVDGNGPSALNRFDGALDPLAYLGELTSALPYHLLERPRVLVLGAGSGADVLQGLYHRARTIDAVELDGAIAALVQGRFGEFSGRPFSRPGVRLHVADARGFVERDRAAYDLIQLSLVDAGGIASAGIHGLSETYLYTVEAYGAYLRRLAPGGMLAVTRMVDLPPRDAPKAFATAVAALEAHGAREPAAQLVMIRGWRTATLLVRNGTFSPGDIERVRKFCRERSFDVAWYPGMPAAEANRYNRLPHAYFHEAAAALLGSERNDFLERYRFDIAPATDDRPFYFHFFRWGAFRELWSMRELGGLPLIEWGYPLLLATLAQASLIGLALIVVPIWLRERVRPMTTARAGRGRVALYFGLLGLAFMLVEIPFIQKFVLFLGHPLYAASTALCAFLVFAGLGSRYSERMTSRSAMRSRWLPFAAIAALAAAYATMLPALFAAFPATTAPARGALAIGLIAPLAFAMGMPFPLGLARLTEHRAELVPWAWAVNGCCSVFGAILAALLAIDLGFTAVIAIAACLYLAAAIA